MERTALRFAEELLQPRISPALVRQLRGASQLSHRGVPSRRKGQPRFERHGLRQQQQLQRLRTVASAEVAKQLEKHVQSIEAVARQLQNQGQLLAEQEERMRDDKRPLVNDRTIEDLNAKMEQTRLHASVASGYVIGKLLAGALFWFEKARHAL
mmetsp:Transcript_26090/g.47677  ORF Transcript_26090/g.47677 Transcript_26090/m.47677 type:complete len:154 (-) Transcript_26090:28-489(-)